jgi:dynein heavy chain 2
VYSNHFALLQPDDEKEILTEHLDRYFYKALDWVRRAPRPPIVETTLIGLILTALSHLRGGSKLEFLCGLVRGFGSNFDLETRASLAKEIFAWANERTPDGGNPVDYAVDRGVLKPLSVLEKELRSSEDSQCSSAGNLVPVASQLRATALLTPWVDKMEPFVLVGPEGCGKGLLVRLLQLRLTVTACPTAAYCADKGIIQSA